MTPQDAYNVLNSATSALTANRATHIQIQQALDIFKSLIAATQTKKNPDAPKEPIDNQDKSQA